MKDPRFNLYHQTKLIAYMPIIRIKSPFTPQKKKKKKKRPFFWLNLKISWECVGYFIYIWGRTIGEKVENPHIQNEKK
jgi:hypothetical protein